MDCQRDAFRRLSPQDEGMMGSPHSTPIKKVSRFAEERVDRGQEQQAGEIPSV